MKRRRTRPRSRRGSIYILVLSTSMLVAAFGLSALLLLRVQGQTASNGNDFIEARLYARSAIEIGMLKIRQDAYWRTHLGNGAWVTNQAIGSGTFSLYALDPVDNDVTNGDNHPIVLTATGTKGNAKYKTSVRLEVGPAAGSCLEVSMCSTTDTSVSGATLTSDQSVCANGKYSAGGGSTVNANVEAIKSIDGSTYTKAKLIRTTPRDMPDPFHCLDYYLANGTTIQYSDLPQWGQTEMLTNTTFETGVSGWYKVGNKTTIQQSSAQTKEGLYSLLVKSRKGATDTVAQDLVPASLALLKNGHTYSITLPVYCAATCTASVVLAITDSGNVTQTLTGTATSIAPDWSGVYNWKDVKATFTPTWTGTLTKATVSPSISDATKDFYIDKVTMTDTTFPKDFYVMDRTLLCPASNPFGSHQTNASGIYILNCVGKKVAIGSVRIVGTLVFVNPGDNSVIQGPLVWEAAVPNYPTLLANDKMAIALNSGSFGEATLGVNLNPPGTPYPYVGGTANSTTADSYPSKITGLIYTISELAFSGSPTIAGVVLSGDQIKVNATSLNPSYSNLYLNNPPPGFSCGIPPMKIVPGTWQRVVD